MTTITKFHENLFMTFKKSNKDIINRIWGQVSLDSLFVRIRKEKEGRYNCINASIMSIHPAGTHKMIVEEIMEGYDAEGSRWSDHMGGHIIDCNGKKVDEAINLIVTKMNELVEK